MSPTQTPDAHVVAERPEEPDGADGREGDGQRDDGGLRERPGVEVEQEQDEQEGERHDDGEPLGHPLLGLVLAAPGTAKPAGSSRLSRRSAFASST